MVAAAAGAIKGHADLWAGWKALGKEEGSHRGGCAVHSTAQESRRSPAHMHSSTYENAGKRKKEPRSAAQHRNEDALPMLSHLYSAEGHDCAAGAALASQHGGKQVQWGAAYGLERTKHL